jgi:hypothetical protein
MPLVVSRDVLELFDIIRSSDQHLLEQIPQEDLEIFKKYFFIVPKNSNERSIHAKMIEPYVQDSMK